MFIEVIFDLYILLVLCHLINKRMRKAKNCLKKTKQIISNCCLVCFEWVPQAYRAIKDYFENTRPIEPQTQIRYARGQQIQLQQDQQRNDRRRHHQQHGAEERRQRTDHMRADILNRLMETGALGNQALGQQYLQTNSDQQLETMVKDDQ